MHSDLSIPFGRRRIGDLEPVVVIAEIGINHEGDCDACVRMIEEAARTGVDAVKLQTVDADASYAPGTASHEIFSAASLTREETDRMFRIARDLGMEPFTTSGDVRTLEWVDKLDPAAHKVSSGLLSHFPYLRAAASLEHTLLVSTGMSAASEVDAAVDVVRQGNGPGFGLFQCTSLYPAPPETLNLAAIAWMRDRYRVPVGFSDHSDGIDAVALSVAAGARMIEKHFTLDTARPGFDHAISLAPAAFREMVERIRAVEAMLGKLGKSMTAAQQKNAARFRRYLVASRDLEPGHVLEPEDIEVMRISPGQKGIDPVEHDALVGRQVTHETSRFAPFNKDDFK